MHVNFKKIAAGVIAVLAYVASPPVLGLIHDAKVTGIITAVAALFYAITGRKPTTP